MHLIHKEENVEVISLIGAYANGCNLIHCENLQLFVFVCALEQNQNDPEVIPLKGLKVKFDQESLLGAGGFGAVYLGYLKTQGNVQVAVKRLNNVPEGGLPRQ